MLRLTGLPMANMRVAVGKTIFIIHLMGDKMAVTQVRRK